MRKDYPCMYWAEGWICTKQREKPEKRYWPEPGVCGPFGCPEETPSNADRIRAMTDEQLAYFLLAVKIDYAGCAYPDHESCPVKGSCYDCWLEWLKEEAKGENKGEDV